jgi:hypothetical protein
MTKITNTKSVATRRWTRPTLIRLGKISDVAGNALANNNGASPNPRS